jgi:hypothetical protein
VRISDLCRRHCERVLSEHSVEPHEPLYTVTWEHCMEDCNRIVGILLHGVGREVVEVCSEKGLYTGHPQESWILSCVKKYLIDMSYYFELVRDIIDHMATNYWKVFKAFQKGGVEE